MYVIEIDDFSILSDRYDTFFVDIWGTIWDGEKVFPSVAETFLTLKAKGKQIVLLSNCPLPEQAIENMLSGSLQKGLHFDKVITSGSFFDTLIKQGWFERTLHRDDYRFFIFGEGESSVLQDIADHHTHDIDTAHIVFVASLLNPFTAITENLQTQAFLHHILEKNIPMVCINPDKGAMHKGQLMLTQGAVAAFYEQMGGQVYYFGKPYAGIFNFACETMGANKTRTIMVGDGLATDIAGANACGIDSVLLTKTGLLSLKDKRMIDNILTKSPVKPTYMTDKIDLKSHDKNR